MLSRQTKRFSNLFMVVALSIGMLLIASSAIALSPIRLSFGIWRGQGTVSVNMPINYGTITSSEIIDAHSVLPSSIYRLGDGGGVTTITLTEEYLNTLPDGDYTYGMAFFGDGFQTFEESIIATQTLVPFSDVNMPRLVKVTLNGSTVDPANYTLMPIPGGGWDLIFTDAFWLTLGQDYELVAYFSQDAAYAILELTVKRGLPDTSDSGSLLAISAYTCVAMFGSLPILALARRRHKHP